MSDHTREARRGVDGENSAPSSRSRAHLALETTEPMSAGHGFISGLLSALLGIAGFGLVLSLRFPEQLMFGELRPLYASPYLRAVVHLALVTAFLFGSVSAVLRANKTLALTGLGFTLAAALLGGSGAVAAPAEGGAAWLSLDFFVLNLLLYSAIFVPLERLFALRAQAAGVPAAMDGRPDLLLHQLAAGRGADDPHAEAGAGPVRLGSRGLAPQCRWRQSRRSPGTAHRPGGGLHPGTGFIGRSMRRRFSGRFTPSIIRQRRWTGWPGHACTWST